MTRIEAIRQRTNHGWNKHLTGDDAATMHTDLCEILAAWDTRETALRALVEKWKAEARELGPFIERYTGEEAWEDEAAARTERSTKEECAEALSRLLEQEP